MNSHQPAQVSLGHSQALDPQAEPFDSFTMLRWDTQLCIIRLLPCMHLT